MYEMLEEESVILRRFALRSWSQKEKKEKETALERAREVAGNAWERVADNEAQVARQKERISVALDSFLKVEPLLVFSHPQCSYSHDLISGEGDVRGGVCVRRSLLEGNCSRSDF